MKGCTAISVEDGDRIVVEWDNGAHPQSALHRLSVCFDAEDPVIFTRRVAAAKKARQMTEAVIRYNLYVDCMPADELGKLDAEQVSRVLARAMSTNEMRRNEFDTSTLLNEINVDYARTMNKIIFDANLAAEDNKLIFDSLSMPEKEPSSPTSEKGVVDVPSFDLEDSFKSFVFNTFLVQPEVCIF